MADRRAAAVEHARANSDRILAELGDFLAIPSISNDPTSESDIEGAAEWMADRLRALGLDGVGVLPTGGNPVVYGEDLSAGPSAPTVLVYGHYDVQSPSPLKGWDSKPFQASVRGEKLYARGASDNKGQIMACVAAVEAAASAGPLPVNVKFLIEGEEEIGSVHLPGFLSENKARLGADVVLNPDAGMLGADRPTIYYGLRGMYVCTLRVSGPSRDLHSGGYGGVVHNPIHALCKVIAGMHDPERRVALPSFYDSVRALAPEERAEMAALPRGDASYLEQSGVPELWGERDYIAAEREGARPALDVIRISGGSTKSAIPIAAEAIVTVRLVPDQSPDEVHEQLLHYLESHVPPTVNWEVLDWSGFPASLTDRNSVAVQSLSAAMETVWGRKPVYYRSGGSIGAVGQMQSALGVDSLLTGFSLPDDHVHGPNERIHLPTWRRGIEALVHFFYNMAGGSAAQ